MRTLLNDAIYKVFQGITSVEEVIRVVNEEDRDEEEKG